MSSSGKILLSIILLINVHEVFAQVKTSDWLFKSSFSIGSNFHPENPVSLPFYFITAGEPKSQDAELSFEGSLLALKKINQKFLLGLSAHYSQFGFREDGFYYGDPAGNRIYYNDLLRSFKTLGFGIIGGVILIRNNRNKLAVYPGFRYERLLRNQLKGIFTNNNLYNNIFAASLNLEYGHRITEHMYLTVGLNSVFSLVEYFEIYGYKPIRYGLSLGIEYEL